MLESTGEPLRVARPVVALFTALGVLAAANVSWAAAGASVTGVVKDAAGKPIRGAIVRAEQGGKLIARYTNKDGGYRIEGLVSNQPRTVSVSAFGFAPAALEPDGSSANFALTPKMDLRDMNSTDMRYLIDENDQTQRHVYYECGNCHGLEPIVARAGMPAAAWEAFLPHMSGYMWGENHFTPEWSTTLAKWITPLFGPEGTMNPNAKPDYAKIKHPPLEDAALNATITEYAVPSPKDTLSYGAQPHSVRVDPKSQLVWFGNYDTRSNNIMKFDPQAEVFTEYKIPLFNAAAHTGTVMEDGTFVVGLHKRKYSPFKMALVRPSGKLDMLEWAGRPPSGRVVTTDPSNKDVVWAVADPETWRINLRTGERSVYQNPKPPTLPEGSFVKEYQWPQTQPRGNGYDVAVDSKGVAWVSQMYQAIIFSIDPESGETKMYHTPEMKSARGVLVDAADNIWFADYYGHKLGMLDPRTGKVTMYQPLNKYSAPYGLAYDAKRGFIWYADLMGNSATRFDPRTKTFADFPLPTARASHRFMGIDAKGRAWYGGFFNSKLGVVDPGYQE